MLIDFQFINVADIPKVIPEISSVEPSPLDDLKGKVPDDLQRLAHVINVLSKELMDSAIGIMLGTQAVTAESLSQGDAKAQKIELLRTLFWLELSARLGLTAGTSVAIRKGWQVVVVPTRSKETDETAPNQSDPLLDALNIIEAVLEKDCGRPNCLLHGPLRQAPASEKSSSPSHSSMFSHKRGET